MRVLLEKFICKCPFAVMTRILTEAFISRHLDGVFEEHREHQYENQLKFSALAFAVADVTPGWHRQTGKLIAIGAQVRYSKKGEQLEDVRRAA